MLTDKRIGFLGGGNMAEALIRGLLAQDNIKPEQLGASDPLQKRLTDLAGLYGIHTESDNRALVQWADVVILAVKPQMLPAVLTQIRDLAATGTLFISIAAGLTTHQIEEALSSHAHVVRAMPNTPALVRSAATALSPGTYATPQHLQIAQTIFDAVGITEEVPESYLDAVTGLSGSGPAYAFVILEALSDAGVNVGLSRRMALRFAAQTLMGSAKLLLDTDGHPSKLKDMVTSPGGTSIAGLHALEAGGLRTTLMNAVEAATNRAKELGKKT